MITLTDEAAQHVSRYLTHHGKGMGLRMGVKTTGCPDLAYKLEYADEITTGDQASKSNSIKVIVNPKNLPYIDGTGLDYVHEEPNEGFRFNNPDVKDGCGCGKSFRV